MNKKETPKATDAEKDIIQSLANGDTIYEISERRETTYNTISTQLAMMRLKFKSSSTIQLVAECLRAKIIE